MAAASTTYIVILIQFDIADRLEIDCICNCTHN